MPKTYTVLWGKTGRKLSANELRLMELKDLKNKKYQGWTNWQTWAVKLYLENEQWSYKKLTELVRQKKFNKNNRSAVALVRYVAKKEGYRTPSTQELFIKTTNFKEIQDSLRQDEYYREQSKKKKEKRKTELDFM